MNTIHWMIAETYFMRLEYTGKDRFVQVLFLFFTMSVHLFQSEPSSACMLGVTHFEQALPDLTSICTLG